MLGQKEDGWALEDIRPMVSYRRYGLRLPTSGTAVLPKLWMRLRWEALAGVPPGC
jgi:hypothetical protein